MYGFGEIDPKVWVPSLKTVLSFVPLATRKKMAPSLCWDFKLSNEGSFVKIGLEMTKLGWKVWKKSLQSLRAELQSLRAESIAVCMQRWSFRRRSLSWETSFDWSEMKVRALRWVSPHPAVRTWPGFQIKWTQPDFSWFFMRTIPAVENRGGLIWPQPPPPSPKLITTNHIHMYTSVLYWSTKYYIHCTWRVYIRNNWRRFCDSEFHGSGTIIGRMKCLNLNLDSRSRANVGYHSTSRGRNKRIHGWYSFVLEALRKLLMWAPHDI